MFHFVVYNPDPEGGLTTLCGKSTGSMVEHAEVERTDDRSWISAITNPESRCGLCNMALKLVEISN